ncbi:hypothetical protein Gotri_019567 [Gossypium trilobum]|uniref:RNase H type-1 domain-containing protein n=1 Tax=Gossypium trilobum TaxID=34281 RepID=A0A7J9EDC1_9ROSI|nr:hypothetical protein [Gossypium trilobum]
MQRRPLCMFWEGCIVGSLAYCVRGQRKRLPLLVKENWKSPEEQIIKINFDASFDCQGFKSASGIVVRNAKGEVLVSKSRLHTAVGTTFDVEALAYFEAVLTGIELDLTDVIVEGDSRSIIKKCKTRLVDKP